ncbi:MAG: SulP family inorganic anion transporter [Streptomycetaceae bacterium]|nr:SulP family inorganic anion transporter [Streptomycetaceae bacterium]
MPSVLRHNLSIVLRRDLSASLVVFLVALPLCVGVAVACGAPAELGLITGIVGGLIAGPMPGSSLQVSGPSPGPTVLVLEAVREHGLPMLGALVLAAGVLQLVMGLLKLGRWFRAISVSVVQGMLAGIGLVLISGQLFAMADSAAPGKGPSNFVGWPRLLLNTVETPQALYAFLTGAGTIAVIVMWKRLPSKVSGLLPAPLVGVALSTAVVWAFSLPVAKVKVTGLAGAVQPPGADEFGKLLSPSGLGTVLAFALIASAESLFSAAAVDRLHHGPRTHYDKELLAQGLGNTVCGALGALPMAAVIVRSAANVQAGARTKASRVLHGVWLLLFAALLPGVLGVIPLSALAGVLVHSGWKLLPGREVIRLWQEHRSEAIVLVGTALAIVATDLFKGVLIGLGLAIVKTAWETSGIHMETEELPVTGDGPVTIRVRVSGNATFLQLPKLLDQLEALPSGRAVELDLTQLRHLDHACRTALTTWTERHNTETSLPIHLTPPGSPTV